MLQPIPVADPTQAAAVVAAPSSPPHPAEIQNIKVLHVVNGEHFSGAERVQSHLGRCLPKFGVTAGFACVKPGKFAQMLRQSDGQWGIGFDAAMRNRFDIRASRRIAELVDQHGYQLLHAHTPRTAMITAIASKLTGLPWVYHVHSPAARDSDKPVSNWINSQIEKQSLRNCSHLIAVSESLRLDCIAKGAAEEQVTVVHNGVPGVRPERTTTPVPGGRWTIGMVALMRPRKGLEIVLDAIAKLEQRNQDVMLRVIGPFETAEYESEIDAQIDRLDIHHRIERMGFTDDVPAALAQLDALVLPSLFGEGLPMVVLEAMAAALPVIATRVEGTPEAITHGVEGLLAQPRDADSLADSIEALVTGQHDWNRMADAAFARHAKCFSDDAMAKGTAAVYRRVV